MQLFSCTDKFKIYIHVLASFFILWALQFIKLYEHAALVDKVEVDVAGLKVGDTIRVKDLSLAKDKDIDIKDDLEAVVLTVVAVHNGAVPETETPEEAETEEAK